jgi:hypothetical protein
MMTDTPNWYPLRLTAHRSEQVLDANGRVFADARNTEAAGIIVLTLNAAVRRDFDIE